MKLLRLEINICANNETLGIRYLNDAIVNVGKENDLPDCLVDNIFPGLDGDYCEPISTAAGEFAESLECDTLKVSVNYKREFSYWNDGHTDAIKIRIPSIIEPYFCSKKIECTTCIQTEQNGDCGGDQEFALDRLESNEFETGKDAWLDMLKSAVESKIDLVMTQAAEKQASEIVRSYIDCEG